MNLEIPRLLAAKLREPLPGPMVHTRFQPTPRLGRNYDEPTDDARRAAVLVLLYPCDGAWNIPLTLRPGDLASHPGQISLPGGALEPGESPPQAAIREFHEELGAVASEVELLGALSPIFVNASNFSVEPWVGAVREPPVFIPNPTEVAEVLEVPLAHLLDPANLDAHTRTNNARQFTAPHFCWASHRIWGATCMILGELVRVLEVMDVEV